MLQYFKQHFTSDSSFSINLQYHVQYLIRTIRRSNYKRVKGIFIMEPNPGWGGKRPRQSNGPFYPGNYQYTSLVLSVGRRRAVTLGQDTRWGLGRSSWPLAFKSTLWTGRSSWPLGLDTSFSLMSLDYDAPAMDSSGTAMFFEQLM